MTTNFNAVMIATASDILGKHCRKSKLYGSEEILEMCDTRRDLKREKNTEEEAAKYSKISKKIRKGMKKAKEDWIEEQCTEFEDCLTNNNSRRAYQVVKELTKQRQVKVNTIQDKEGKCLTEEKDQQMDRVLFKTIQLPDQRRPLCPSQTRIIKRG